MSRLPKIRDIGVAWIIHRFAFLHALVAVVCREAQVDDSMILTMLTMVMTVWLCYKAGMEVELSAAFVILVNIFGFLLGTYGAKLIGLFSDSPLVIHPLASLLTTEILGWTIHWLTGFANRKSGTAGWTKELKWFLAVFLVILLVRIVYTLAFSQIYSSSEEIYSYIERIVLNAPALFVLLCGDFLYVRFARKYIKKRSFWVKLILFIIFSVLISSLVSVMVGMNLPFGDVSCLSDREFLRMSFPTMLTQVTVYFLIYMADYVLQTRRAIQEQRLKAAQAEYSYFKLKQQVNPHFLFNSLNILDGLVSEGKKEQAEEYIGKLAGIYRYMLRDEELVKVREELDFACLYVDLLKVRFGGGFEFVDQVRQEDMNRSLIPCALQLLIENAIKHNVVGGTKKLVIKVTSDGENLIVSNNILPKLSTFTSSGVGHKYLKEEYLRHSNTSLVFSQTDDEYKVYVPLL